MLLKTFVPAIVTRAIPVALAVVLATPAMAQDTGDPLAPPSAMDETMPSALSPEQQAQYDVWPAEVQAYHDMLSPSRQGMFWRLNDQDKVSLANMSPMEQEQVWTAIESSSAQGPAGGVPEGPPEGPPVTPSDTPPAEPMEDMPADPTG